MSALRDAMSHAVLGWVKPELDETLRQARGEIEAFVENPSDSSRMRFCAGYLHQVQGTLRMVELYAPAMVAEEMELLAQALQQGATGDRDEACATLMRGTVLLPDYLERLQNGHRDIPIVLLPLLNDIRAARGATGLDESVLFAPDLSAPLPAQLPAAVLPWPQRQDRVVSTLAGFQRELEAWPAGAAPADPTALATAAGELLQDAGHETTRRMLWVLSRAAEALRDGALAPGESLRTAFAAAARALQQASENESLPVSARGVPSQEPTRQLLYAVAQARAPHPALDELRQAFDLDAQVPSEAELDHARGSLAGRNRDLLNTVGAVVKEELLRVKDALDLHLRTGGDAAALQPQAAELTRVADTLGMLGLGVARDVVLQQRDSLQAIAAGEAPASEGALLDIAGALLYVDASLDDQVARLGAGEEGGEDAAAAETRRTVEVLAHEAIANFAAAREDFVAFIETNWDHARLETVPRLLEEVAGALHMLDLPEPAGYLEGVRRYIVAELIGRRRVPSGRQLDTLADAMASLEYYLEALRDRRPNRAEILEIARSSLESLNYWPLPDTARADVEGAGEAVVPVAPGAPADAGAGEMPAAASGLSPSAAMPPPLPAAPGPEAPALDWDSVQLEAPATFAPVEDEYTRIDPVELSLEADPAAPDGATPYDAPQREALELPGLEIGLAPIAPALPTIEPVLTQQPFHYDPVSGEYIATAPAEAGAVDAGLPADAGMALVDTVASAPDAEDAPAPGYPQLDASLHADAPQFGATLDAASLAPAIDTDAGDATLGATADANAAAEWSLDIAPAAVEPPAMDPAAAVPVQAPAGTPPPVPPAPAEHGRWLDLTVHIRPRVAPEARPAAPPVTGPGTAPHADEPFLPATPAMTDPDVVASAIPDESTPAPATPAGETTPDTSREGPVLVTGGAIFGGFDENQDIDADIREVFLEEFDEERDNLARLLPVWARSPDDMERLRPIRRVFHTLKGSGRLVGASALGEFSWKIESMLNRVLDGTRPASPAVIAMVQQASELLPQFDAALRGHASLGLDLRGLESVAERIAAGEEAFYSMPAANVAAAVEAPAAEAVSPMLAAGTPASVDSVLREILETEVATHLETVDAWIAAARQAPQPVSDPLLRAMHTMNGAFAMTDVPEITSVTDPAESYIKRAIAAGHVPGHDAVEALADTAATIRACIVALQAESPRIPSYASLAARLQALAGELPEARWPRPEELDDEAAMPVPVLAPAIELSDVDLSGYLVEAMAGDEPADQQDPEALQPQDPVAGHLDADAPPPAEAFAATVADVSAAAPWTLDDAEAAATAAGADGTASLDGAFDAGFAALGAAGEDADGQAPSGLAAAGSGTDADLAHAQGETPLVPEAPGDAAVLAGGDGVVDAFPYDLSAADTDAGVVTDAQDPAQAGAAQPEATSDTMPAPVEPVEDGDPATDALGAGPFEEDEQFAAGPAGAGEAVHAPEAGDPEAPTDPLADGAPVPAVDEASTVAASAEVPDQDGLPEATADTADAGPAWSLSGDTPAARSQDVEGDDADLPGADAADIDAAALAASETDVAVDGAPSDAAGSEVVLEEHAASGLSIEAVDASGSTSRDDAPADASVDVSAEDQAPVAPATVEAAAELPMLDFSELDRDLVDIFVEEGGDLLDHVDAMLVELRADCTAREPITGLQRDLHTLKGGARMAGIATIGDLGHVIESLLEAAAEHRTVLDRSDVHLLERGFDTLHQLLVKTRAHRTTAMPHALIAEFEARIRGEARPAPQASDAAVPVEEAPTAPAEAAEAAPAAAPVQWPVAEAATAATTPEPAERAGAQEPYVLPAAAMALAPLSAPVEEEAAAPADEVAVRAPQEQVRVRADLLDNLVNHAGEVAIYRSRLEQQLGAFRSALAELDRTNARLRDQLRRLDLETEAQIVARYQREQDSADPTFDPLELDRFSTLQQLSRALNESSADLTGLQGVLDDLSRQYDVLLQQQSRVSSDLQDGLMSARMVPFDSVVPRLRRVVRQAGHDTGKHVQLRLDGTHGELDRNVLDRMVAPIEHMLRNSVAHGLETPAERTAAGKAPEGGIIISLRHEGSEIVLQVADDGRGLDRAAIRRRAEQRGLLKPDAVLTDAELDSLIFEAGFSTSEQVSQLAGRGVGMDVVRNEVRQLGGTVEIDSAPGRGVVFTLRLPQTLAVTQAVFVQIGETTYAVPVASVSGIGRISRERFEGGTGGYRYAGEDYVLHDLGLLVGQGPAKAEGQAQVPLLLVRAGDLRAAVAIDQVVGNREIVVKPVGLQIASVPGIYGATITGDGRVVVILDVAPLVRRHLAQPERPAAQAESQQQRHVPLVMVVDDSLTMRKVTGRVLERHNFEVATARDGVEALERLEERVPDLMLLDIEMPRMDGYELATAMRADPRFRGVPIVMITSRTGEKHRQRAFEIGVQRYLGKPYQELDLMRNVYDLLGIARARE